MQWHDKGIVLSAKKHGENALIIKLLTENHGIYSGVVRYGVSKKVKFMFEPGNLLSITWKARLPEHIGSFKCEVLELYLNNIINKPQHLAALSSHCALEELLLPEREKCQSIFTQSIEFLTILASKTNSWAYDYIRWEINFLKELGFGLDLTKCAVTGQKHDLLYVSPKTGRAISRNAAGKWANRLFPLPSFIINKDCDIDQAENKLYEGIKISSYFLNKYAQLIGLELPNARKILIKNINK